MKRVTVNFKFTDVSSDAEADDLLRRCRENGRPYLFDRRNGIYCIEPTLDAVCYLNYLEYLNANYKDWKSFGYFDLGMIPLFMAPSFMQESLMNELDILVSAWQIPIYTMRACSLLGTSYFGVKDSWVKREDFEAATGIPADKASMSAFLKNAILQSGGSL